VEVGQGRCGALGRLSERGRLGRVLRRGPEGAQKRGKKAKCPLEGRRGKTIKTTRAGGEIFAVCSEPSEERRRETLDAEEGEDEYRRLTEDRREERARLDDAIRGGRALEGGST